MGAVELLPCHVAAGAAVVPDRDPAHVDPAGSGQKTVRELRSAETIGRVGAATVGGSTGSPDRRFVDATVQGPQALTVPLRTYIVQECVQRVHK
jgi:hypothetical protein